MQSPNVLKNLLLVMIILITLPSTIFAGIFENPAITLSYSELLTEKNTANDSLMPILDGEESIQELFRRYPRFWELNTLGRDMKIATKLNVEIVFVDGNREEDFCEIVKRKNIENAENLENPESLENSASYNWHLKLGLDFISGSSNNVHQHVKLCLQRAREELGVVIVNKLGKLELLLPKMIEEKVEEYRVNAELTSEQKQTILAISDEVKISGKCPKDIDSYLILMDLYDKVNKTPSDPFQLNDELNPSNNGSRIAESCAFSREWNQLFNETFRLKCNINKETCLSIRSGQDEREWMFNFDKREFEFQGFSLLGISFGEQSVTEGGEVLNLKLIPLSKNIYLESYLDNKGDPKSLGMLILEDLPVEEDNIKNKK